MASVGAVIGSLQRPEAVVAGRYTADGDLVIVGRTTPLPPALSADLARILEPISPDEHPWPAEISSGHFGGGTVAITHVAPTVVGEFAADPALQGGRHRHALRLLRLRLDLGPADIGIAGTS